MSQFDLTDEQSAIQEMAQRFTADAITPHAAVWDETHHFPRDVVKAAAELGFGAIYVSEESGGIGLGRLEAALSNQYGRTVHLNIVVDPDIIGGMRVEIGDDVIDGTVSGRLDEARRKLAG